MDGDARNPLAERYGRQPRRPRAAVLVGVGLALAAITAWALWAGLSHSRKDVSWEVVSFVTQADGVSITFRLHRTHNVPVDCTFRARGRDGSEVGRATVTIPPSRRSTVTTVYPLHTTTRPVSGEIESCEPTSSE